MNAFSHILRRLRYNRYTIAHQPFYKRYPYQDKISLNSADDRGCIDFKLGFFCNRIPKAANSTVITNIVWLATGEMLTPKQAKLFFRTPAQIKAGEMPQFDRLFKFTFVRNPYTRTLSAYLEKVARRSERANKTPETFAQFLESLEHARLYSNAHWAPQADLLLIPAKEFNFIGKVESLQEDMHSVVKKLCPDKEIPMTSAVKHATGANEKLLKYYDPECIERVKTLFQKDFKTFGYDTAFPPQ